MLNKLFNNKVSFIQQTTRWFKTRSDDQQAAIYAGITMALFLTAVLNGSFGLLGMALLFLFATHAKNTLSTK